MFKRLSDSQRLIVDCNTSRIVVKACPGSGKTFSVTARLARLLASDSPYRHQGIAALSFTNIACEEMRKGLYTEYSISDIRYPHFIGTLDSFINNYIFFPFGHLLMGCNQRPEIVGTEYNKWFEFNTSLTRCIKNKKGNPVVISRDANYYFDKVSFDINDDPIPLAIATAFHFSWTKMRNKDGSFCKNVADIISAKKKHFKEGKANQSDANYWAYKVLCKYPSIAKNIAQRFPTIIVDEAQDTTTIQMAIIDILDRAGAESIMLIGDPDQAIFEWNTANPSLFMDKYNSGDWESLELSENRRSSSNICSVINRFFGGTMSSVAQSRDCHELPELKQHQTNSESIHSIIEEFKAKCYEMGIEEDLYSIVYRGRTFGEKYLNLSDESSNIGNSMWDGGYFVRDIVHGKYLIDNGQFKRGLHLIGKGYLKMKYGIKYVSIKQSKEEIEKHGYRNFRQVIFQFIDSLPLTNQTLNNWIINANSNGNEFLVNSIKANIDISRIFHNETITISSPSCFKTIHSVKGMSLEAILVFVTKGSASKDYSTIFSIKYNEPDITKRRKDEEEIRIIYVACSRPKKLLWLAVPAEDIACWSQKLGLR